MSALTLNAIFPLQHAKTHWELTEYSRFLHATQPRSLKTFQGCLLALHYRTRNDLATTNMVMIEHQLQRYSRTPKSVHTTQTTEANCLRQLVSIMPACLQLMINLLLKIERSLTYSQKDISLRGLEKYETNSLHRALTANLYLKINE